MRSACVTYTVCCIENAPSQVIHRFQKFVNVFVSINVRARNIVESGWPVAHDVFTVDVFLAEEVCSLGEAIFWVTCGCSEYAYSWEIQALAHTHTQRNQRHALAHTLFLSVLLFLILLLLFLLLFLFILLLFLLLVVLLLLAFVFLPFLSIFELGLLFFIKLPSLTAFVLRLAAGIGHEAVLVRRTLRLVGFLTVCNACGFALAISVVFLTGCGYRALSALVIRKAFRIVGILVLAAFCRIEHLPIWAFALVIWSIVGLLRIWYAPCLERVRPLSHSTFFAFAVTLIAVVSYTASQLDVEIHQ
jgi:hypothetical protein